MTETYYRTGNYKPDHATFGGLIYASDFETDYRGNDNNSSWIANRIMNDLKFDECCMKNINNRNKMKMWRDKKND